MTDKAKELARDLIRELTNQDGWNETPSDNLVYALADFVDPENDDSLSALAEGRDKL